MTFQQEIPQITLKAARVNAGLTIAEASKKLSISHGTLVKWERSPGNVTPIQQKKIEEVYNFPTNYIFFG
ncbi:Helix-turn-helix [Thalassobacillus cyri]|uniref:Helix-turn-helix n=1 Tax=Thalassobacillus cyri TaxID=571932 RepID=A0A1H4H2L3_9BACI|nr:helix-turn-helix transcriptional regulator [Thalassobacillus cyri]SEB16014.1 Helix-turn-helix [Thalassobacillus cyri]